MRRLQSPIQAPLLHTRKAPLHTHIWTSPNTTSFLSMPGGGVKIQQCKKNHTWTLNLLKYLLIFFFSGKLCPILESRYWNFSFENLRWKLYCIRLRYRKLQIYLSEANVRYVGNKLSLEWKMAVRSSYLLPNNRGMRKKYLTWSRPRHLTRKRRKKRNSIHRPRNSWDVQFLARWMVSPWPRLKTLWLSRPRSWSRRRYPGANRFER